MAWIVKAPDVADFDGENDRDDQGNSAQSLIGRHERRHRPDRDEFLDVAFKSGETVGCVAYRIDQILKDNLLGWMVELLLSQPPQAGCASLPAALEDPPVSQKERLQLLAFLA
ncbi:hypothetical protein GGD83_004587 [Rhodoblastus sphagnicola]|nr:hypothetical protein [Rhodoblastus sphagnicola]